MSEKSGTDARFPPEIDLTQCRTAIFSPTGAPYIRWRLDEAPRQTETIHQGVPIRDQQGAFADVTNGLDIFTGSRRRPL